MNSRKIVVISNTFPPFSGGGVATAQYNIFKKLQEKDFDVTGLTFYDHGKIKLEEENIKRFGAPKTIHRLINSITKLFFSRKQKIDCSSQQEYAWQYNFSINSAIGCWLINLELQKIKPDIIIIPDLGTPNFFLKKPANSTIIMVSHHNALRFIDNPLIDKHSKIDAELVNKMENKGMKIVDKVICPSQYMKEFFQETHMFNGSVEVVPNVVNEELIQSFETINIREEIGLSKDSPLIYIPLANTPVKGPRYMYEIIRRLSKFYKDDIGFYLSGGMTEELEFELQYIPENVKIYSPGFLEYEKNIGVIKGCDFGITPALLESFGMAVLEGHMCGVPFVSFNCGGNEDIIDNEQNGFLVDYLDVETLIEKSKTLLQDITLRETFSNRARTEAYNDFNSEATIHKLVKFIEN